MNPEELQQLAAQQGVILTPEQMHQLQVYNQLLNEANQVMNLTAITDSDQVYLKHFYDSLTPLFVQPQLAQPVSLVDIGSGAGFPGLVLKIANPQLQLTLVDSLNKRINFLQTLVQRLHLTDVTLIHQRAEDLGHQKQYREHFDFATARAVASLPTLLELCLPTVKVGGQFIALKATKTAAEVAAAQKALHILGGQVHQIQAFSLPHDAGQRELVLINKISTTPTKYPRKPGTPSREPL